MATWQELSLENLEAAKALLSQGYFRSCISRSYYAAYCALTSRIAEQGVSFPHRWNNPAHEQLPHLITYNLSLSQNSRRRLKKLIRLLRHAREDADYRPGISVDRSLAVNSIRDATAVLDDLGVRDESS